MDNPGKRANLVHTLENYPLQQPTKVSSSTSAPPTTHAAPQKTTPPPSPPPGPSETRKADPCTPRPFGSTAQELGSRVRSVLQRRLADILNDKIAAKRNEIEQRLEMQEQIEKRQREAEAAHDTDYHEASTATELQGTPAASARPTQKQQPLASSSPAAFPTSHLVKRSHKKTAVETKSSNTGGYVRSVRDRVEKYRVADAVDTAPVQLVRVNRLQAIPNYNRGMYAGLDDAYTTRSGHYVVGGRQDSRVRPAAWYAMNGARGSRVDPLALGPYSGVDGTSLRDQYLFMRTYGDEDGRTFFQWSSVPVVIDISRLAAAKAAEGNKATTADGGHADKAEGGLHNSRHGAEAVVGPRSSVPNAQQWANVSADDDVLDPIRNIVDEKYAKNLTEEEREEAKRLLQEKRRQGANGHGGGDALRAGDPASAATSAVAQGGAQKGTASAELAEDIQQEQRKPAGPKTPGTENHPLSGSRDDEAGAHPGLAGEKQGGGETGLTDHKRVGGHSEYSGDEEVEGTQGGDSTGGKGSRLPCEHDPKPTLSDLLDDRGDHQRPGQHKDGQAEGKEGPVTNNAAAAPLTNNNTEKGHAAKGTEIATSNEGATQSKGTAKDTATASGNAAFNPPELDKGQKPTSSQAGGRHSLDHTATAEEVKQLQSEIAELKKGNAAASAGDHTQNTLDAVRATDDFDEKGDRIGDGKRDTAFTEGLYCPPTHEEAQGNDSPVSTKGGKGLSATAVGGDAKGKDPHALPALDGVSLKDTSERPSQGSAAAQKNGHQNTTSTSAAGALSASQGAPKATESGAPKEDSTNKSNMSLSVPKRRDSVLSDLLSEDEDEKDLDLLLAKFPETENHVQLRRRAKGIFANWGGFGTSDDDMDGDDEDNGDGRSGKGGRNKRDQRNSYKRKSVLGANGSFDQNQVEESDDEEIQGFALNEDKIREKFRKEAEDELKELIEERNRLREEVNEQDMILDSFHKDVYHLSRGKDGFNSEHFALELTKDVNLFAKQHHLKLSKMLEHATAENIEEVADGFLRRFGKGRPDTKEVGTQVTDQDLGYVDEGVQQVEARLNDLYFHEKGLIQSIKLATVAVANIMSFHSSLEMESTCKECFYIFENPRTLWPCGHTFCLQCLSGMYNRNEELICAECGSVCEVGYTPNLTIELISNYQLLRESSEANGQAHGGKGKTIESVLRSIMNDLLSTQRSYGAAVAPEPTPQRIHFE